MVSLIYVATINTCIAVTNTIYIYTLYEYTHYTTYMLYVYCTDIDECNNSFPCDQMCTNTIGSFECSCESGYSMEGNLCTGNNYNGWLVKMSLYCLFALDINECLSSPCNHTCTNTPGSFVCSCNDGYELGPDRLSCQGINV